MSNAPTQSPWHGRNTHEEYMAAGLRLLAMHQVELFRIDRGHGFQNTTEEVRTLSFAAMAEIMELADELGWKSWKPRPEVDRERVLSEWADIYAFFGTLTALIIDRLAVPPEELIQAYFDKNGENHRRFSERDSSQLEKIDITKPLR